MRFVRKWVRIWAGRLARKRHQAQADKQASRPPLTSEQFRRNVLEDCERTIGLYKEGLTRRLSAQPPAHPGDVYAQIDYIAQRSLERAMLDWRESKDPRPWLDEAKATFDAALPIRPDFLDGNWHDRWYPGVLPVLASLRGWSFPVKNEPPADYLAKFPVLWMEQWINVGLADPTCWPLKAKAPATRNQLIDRTLDDYWALLTDQIDPNEGNRRCIKNYGRRATHPTFKTVSSFLGGGQYNELYVDYLLAAILKQRGLVSGSVHDWVWG